VPATNSLVDPRKAAKATIRIVFLLSAVLTLVFLISFVFSEEGISELQRARRRVDDLQTQLAQMEVENARLRREIESLKRSTFAVERIAREDLGMSKPGEIVYMFPRDQQ
jgi:cell division protein FtsL